MNLSKVRWILLSLLFALPLTFFPFFYLAFELPKIFLLYSATLLIVIFLLASGHKLASLTKTSWLFFLLLGWFIFTALLGLFPQQSLLGSYFRIQGLLSWLCYGVLFFCSGTILDNHHFRRYAGLAVLIGAAAAASIAVVQFILLWFLGNNWQLLYSGRVISTFGQPNFLGAYLVMSLPFAWFAFKQTTTRGKLVIGFLMIVIILGIFSTTSRSAYAGLIFLALIWGIYHYRLFLAGLISSVIVFAILANLFPTLIFREWYRFKVDTDSKWTAENRLAIVQKSLELIQQKPVSGYGLENFSLAFPKVIKANDLGLKDITVDSSHNFFLDLTVQTGLVGLGLFLMLLIVTFRMCLRYLDTVTLEYKSYIKSSLAAAGAFLIIHQFSVISTGPMVLFWLSLGIIKGPSLAYFPLARINKYIIIFLGAVVTYLTILLMIQTGRADNLFRQAGAYEVSDIYKAINLDNEAINLAPWIKFYQIRRDFLLEQLGFPKQESMLTSAG